MNDQIPVLDFTKEEDFLKTAPNFFFTEVYKTELSGLGLIHESHPACEYNEHCYQQHGIVVHLKPEHNSLRRTYKLRQAINYINDNLDQKIKLDDVAKLIDISQYYFCHLFKESTGIAPYQYVIKQRIEKARELVKQSKLPLAEIAFECGFSSQSQMTQHFRRSVGVTPKVYRNRL